MKSPKLTLRLAACSIFFGTVLLAQSSGTLTTTSMASYGPIVAPDSIAAIWGTGLSGGATPSTTSPPPTSLGGAQVLITDSTGAKVQAPLFLVSPTQINLYIPATVALGAATVTLTTTTSANGETGTLLVSNVAPAIFTANADGKGVPAAEILTISSAGVATYSSPFSTTSPYTATTINLSTTGNSVYLVLYGSGIRRHSLNPVIATIGGVAVPVLYAGAQSQFPGLDQVNIGPLPTSLVNMGLISVMLTVDGVPANPVQLMF